MILTYRYRVKSLLGELNRQARAVNFVWNYCNDIQKQALKWGKKWPSGYDLQKLTTGSNKELGLFAGTINKTCEGYARSRSQQCRPYLRWRGKKSLGWVPIKSSDLKRVDRAFRVAGNTFLVFDSRPLPEGRIADSSFSQDARGNWFLNVAVNIVSVATCDVTAGVGIDLGLKDFATLSDGSKVENPRHLSGLARRLGVAQRARKKRQARNIHARIRNARRDFHHKLSTRIVQEFDYIAVGNVNAARLAKTSMAKSVLDAGWSSFRNMLRYKAIRHGVTFVEVDEKFTSQVCSSCGTLPDSRPKGIADLGIRHWVCSDCGASHDRDVNAAKNILARSGHRAPVEGIGA